MHTSGLEHQTQDKKSKLSAIFNSIMVYQKNIMVAPEVVLCNISLRMHPLIYSAEKQVNTHAHIFLRQNTTFKIKYACQRVFPIQFLCGLGYMLSLKPIQITRTPNTTRHLFTTKQMTPSCFFFNSEKVIRSTNTVKMVNKYSFSPRHFILWLLFIHSSL